VEESKKRKKRFLEIEVPPMLFSSGSVVLRERKKKLSRGTRFIRLRREGGSYFVVSKLKNRGRPYFTFFNKPA